MKNFMTLLLLSASSFAIGCATSQVPVGPQSNIYEPPPPAAKKRSIGLDLNDYQIDYDGLQNYLKLQRRPSRLGFAQKAFNSCRVGYGLPKGEMCRKLYYNVVHFRLQCRDQEGTTSTVQTHVNTAPIAKQTLNWTLERAEGNVETDYEGFGQIRAITYKPAARQRLKISNGEDFLYLRAGDLTRVVTPPEWCR